MGAMPVVEAGRGRLTYADYLRTPEDGQRHEILDGEHFVSATPLDRHQVACGNLYGELRNFLKRRPLGEARIAPSAVILSDHDIVEPDVYVVLAAKLGGFQRLGFVGAPDLVIEVLSPSNTAHDLVRKLPRYELAGVREYWVADPDTQRVEVYRREEGAPERFASPQVLQARRGEGLETPLLPGFTLEVAEVFDPGMLPEGAWEREDGEAESR